MNASRVDSAYDSPILNEKVPVQDIANLPDIEVTRTQMLDLIERVRADQQFGDAGLDAGP